MFLAGVDLRIGLFHLATTKITPQNDMTFVTKAVGTPANAITKPASAGPTAENKQIKTGSQQRLGTSHNPRH